MIHMYRLRSIVLTAFVLPASLAQRVGAPTDALDKVTPDELFSVQVTSVGRKAQQLSKAPAAVFVLTAEDIRRSGATSIPEALQWVPGLTVLRLDSRSWVVSARGGARLYADKILLMIDGRSLYMPLFSGVVWDAIDVPMADIEQIEVVRGPGAVMWGPNAVNGVINIITKRAKATTGGQVSVASGNELRTGMEAHWGAAPSDALAYRIWGKLDYRTPAFGSPGSYWLDNQFLYQSPGIRNLNAATGSLGFRAGGQIGERDQWMIQAEGSHVDRQEPLANPILAPVQVQSLQGHTDYETGSVQAKWTHTASAGSESELQFTYGRYDFNYPYVVARVNNLTVDYQNRVQTGEHNELYWGAGYQQYWDATEDSKLSFSPANSVYRSLDVVLRDEWQFVPGRWTASMGIRLDYNSYKKLEYQPSFRLLFTPSSKQSAWMGISRAVRVPSRIDRDIDVDEGGMILGPVASSVYLRGTKNFQSEVERGLEAGYRVQSGQKWSIDASVFWSYYGRLRLLHTVGPQRSSLVPAPAFRLDLYTCNGGAGRSYGGEIWGSYQVREHWRIVPSYSYLNESKWMPAVNYYRYAWDATPATVPHQGLLRSQHDLSRNVRLDLMARVRSRDTSLNLPGVLLVDARVAWRPTRSGELSVSVQNLANRQVLEALPEIDTPAIPTRRTFLVRWIQRF